MNREYFDLLSFPMESGGIDTPTRLALVATKLGYTHIGLYRPRQLLDKKIGIELLSVGDEGTRTARRADLRIARGRRSRGAVSSGRIDFIVPDPRDRVTIRVAGKNDVPIAYSYSRLLMERSIRRSNILRSWNIVHENAVKHGCREILVSGAGDSYLLRDPRDLVALLVSTLDLSAEEAVDWLSTTPSEILGKARERNQ